MAVVKIPEASRLILVFDGGDDGTGKRKTVTRTFSNVKDEATDRALYLVAQSIAGLQALPLMFIHRQDRAELLDDGQ